MAEPQTKTRTRRSRRPLAIRGVQQEDYFDIVCDTCGTPTRNEYFPGKDVVPHFRATCHACRRSGWWKLSSGQWGATLPIRRPGERRWR